jgi:hypothetical protein
MTTYRGWKYGIESHQVVACALAAVINTPICLLALVGILRLCGF